MSQDQDLARQEFLEAVLSGIGGPACAPMPGTLVEMLEIAAFERRNCCAPALPRQASEPKPLTCARNDSRMVGLWRRLERAALDVAGRFRASARTWRVPV